MLLDFGAVKEGRSTQTFAVRTGDPLLQGFFGGLATPLGVIAEIREQPHRSFLVEVRVRGEVDVGCRRCLEPVRQAIDDRSIRIYEVRGAAETPGAGEDEAEVLPLRSVRDRVDIGPAVRESLFLAAEPFPVCRPECRGLCPECGEDLNLVACGCVVRETDVRWRALEDLRP
jgi:uncharacterized protein